MLKGAERENALVTFLDLNVREALFALTGQRPEPETSAKGYEVAVEIRGARFAGTGSSAKRALWDLLLDIALRAQHVTTDRD